MQTAEQHLIRRLTDYERMSGILWLVIAVIQICTIVGAIAGIWNIFAGRSRLKASKRIALRDSNIPKEFEPMSQLIVIGVINLLLGGVIGIFFVAFDFYIRDKVLTNEHLFTGMSQTDISENVIKGTTPTDFDHHLRKLMQLKEDGIISEEDFNRKKREILNS